MRASLTASTGQAQASRGLHLAQPHEAGRRLLGRAEHRGDELRPRLVQHADQVGAVVERDLRLAGHQRADVRRVEIEILAVDRVDLEPVAGDERRRDVVLRRERVGGAQRRPARRPPPARARGSRSPPSGAGTARRARRRAAAPARSARRSARARHLPAAHAIRAAPASARPRSATSCGGSLRVGHGLGSRPATSAADRSEP